jgi:hypothetical protein
MATAKDEILGALRKQVPIETPALPEVLEGDWIRYADPITQFSNLIAAVVEAASWCREFLKL